MKSLSANTKQHHKDTTLLLFIGKERDEESRLADHGVRKYDYDLARFTCPDPLWEKYYSWTPYQYAGCNPVSMMDDLTNILIIFAYYVKKGH